jgi:hypothetical protein
VVYSANAKPKVLRRYLLFHLVLEVVEADGTSVDGHDAAHQRPSFLSTGPLFVVRQLAVEVGQEGTKCLNKGDARREHRLGRKLGLPRYSRPRDPDRVRQLHPSNLIHARADAPFTVSAFQLPLSCARGPKM